MVGLSDEDEGGEGEKGVRCSEEGIRGKEAVWKVYRSRGVLEGGGEEMMSDVLWIVHCLWGG